MDVAVRGGSTPSFRPGAACEQASRQPRQATAQLVPESLSDRARGLAGCAVRHASAKATEAVLRCFGTDWARLARRRRCRHAFTKKHRVLRHNCAFWLPPPPGGRGLLGLGQDPDTDPRIPIKSLPRLRPKGTHQVTTSTPSQGIPIKSLSRHRPKGPRSSHYLVTSSQSPQAPRCN